MIVSQQAARWQPNQAKMASSCSGRARSKVFRFAWHPSGNKELGSQTADQCEVEEQADHLGVTRFHVAYIFSSRRHVRSCEPGARCKTGVRHPQFMLKWRREREIWLVSFGGEGGEIRVVEGAFRGRTVGWVVGEHGGDQIDAILTECWADGTELFRLPLREVCLVVSVGANARPDGVVGGAHAAKDEEELVNFAVAREECLAVHHLNEDAADGPDVSRS